MTNEKYIQTHLLPSTPKN